MSNWVHIDCMFRTKLSGSETFFENEIIDIPNRRKIRLKKVYKAVDKINRIKGLYKGGDRDLRFSINPEFISNISEYDDCISYDFDDTIVVNIYGDVRDDTDEDNKFTDLIKDIWYNSNLYIDYGICSIRENYTGGKILRYKSYLKKIRIFKNDLWDLHLADGSLEGFKFNDEEEWFELDGLRYQAKDLFIEPEFYIQLFKEKGICLEIIDKEI